MVYPFMQQESYNDCGLACLAMIYKFYYKNSLSINQLKLHTTLTPSGIRIDLLKDLAKKYCLDLEAYKITFEQLKKITFKKPLILQLYSYDIGFHFVVIYKKKHQKWLVADPKSTELCWKDINEFIYLYSNIVLSTTTSLTTTNSHDNKQSQKSNCFLSLIIPKYFDYIFCLTLINIALAITFFIAQVFYKNFINQIIINNSLQLALMLLLTFFFINVVKLMINFILNKFYQYFYTYFTNYLVKKYHHCWFTLAPTQVNKYNDSEYLQIYQDINNIATMLGHNFLEIIINFITMIIACIILIEINFLIWLITFLNCIITLIINVIVMLLQKPLIKKNILNHLDFQQQVILTNKVYEDAYFRNLKSQIESQLHNKYYQQLKNDCKLSNCKINNNGCISFIKNIINFVTIYLSLILIFNHTINFSQLIFITSITTYVIDFFQNSSNFLMSLPEFKKSAQRFSDFINTAKMLLKVKHQKQNNLLLNNKITIAIINCYFKIEEKFIFNNLNLTLTTNNLLIGKTGIGKTTFLHLLSTKNFDFQGQITINQLDLKLFSAPNWQNYCVYLSSQPVIYNGTVLENIFGFEITKDKLAHFEKLQLALLLNDLGLTTTYHCYNQGLNLSQGQKQIIAFLSLFFHDWKLILLDEILSNVNYQIKSFLIKKLLTNCNDALIIYATHDLELKKTFY